MSKLLFLVVMIISLAIFGCGEQADDAGSDNGDNGDVIDDAAHDGGNDDAHDADDDHGDATDDDDHGTMVSGLDLDTPEMAVGQWIEYGADQMRETVTISVVGTEMNQGDECYWVQINADDFVGQVLVDAEGIEAAMEDGQAKFGEFAANPEAYIRENMPDASGMADMFGDQENMEMALEFISALRMVKFEQQGMVMAIDLDGVPEFLEEMMDDPSFQDQFEQGFAQGFNAEGGQEGLDTIMEELDRMEFSIVETDADVAGTHVSGIEFSIVHPEGEISVFLTSELPLIPLAYAEVTGDGETHSIEVRGFGFSGAENLLPGEPAQTIQAMMFLQGMQQQMGAMGAGN
jgi:hypothetical protein